MEEGQVNNLLTEETHAGWVVTLVASTLLTEENLKMEEGQVNNLLTEETPAGWGWLPQHPSY